MPASPLDSTWSKDVGRGMTSPPLDSAHGRTTSSATCHHRLWKAHTVERRRAWHAIITYGQHKRSNDIGHGIPSSPLDTMHVRTTSGVACQHCLWAAHGRKTSSGHDITSFKQHTRSNNVERDMPSPPLENTHGRTMSSATCHHYH